MNINTDKILTLTGQCDIVSTADTACQNADYLILKIKQKGNNHINMNSSKYKISRVVFWNLYTTWCFFMQDPISLNCKSYSSYLSYCDFKAFKVTFLMWKKKKALSHFRRNVNFVLRKLYGECTAISGSNPVHLSKAQTICLI